MLHRQFIQYRTCLLLIEISECGVGKEGASVEQLEEEAISIKVSAAAAGSGGGEKSKGEEAIKRQVVVARMRGGNGDI